MGAVDGELGYVVGDFMGDLVGWGWREFVYWETSGINACNSTRDRTELAYGLTNDGGNADVGRYQ